MLNWLKGLFKKDDESDAKPVPEGSVTCNSCGFVGTMAEFLVKDPTDTFCPVCGEDNELTFEV